MELAFRCAWRYGARCSWPVRVPGGAGPAVGDLLRKQWLETATSSRGWMGIRSLGAGAAPSVPASLVKELRGRTGASMGKCRQALAEESGDIEKAVDWLRRRGIRSMERRTNEAAESMLAICTHAGGAGSIVELCAETDFVTQNALFQELAISVACTHAARGAGGQGSELGEVLLAASTPELSAKLSSGASVQAALLELGSVLGERLVLGQSRLLEASPSSGGVVAGH